MARREQQNGRQRDLRADEQRAQTGTAVLVRDAAGVSAQRGDRGRSGAMKSRRNTEHRPGQAGYSDRQQNDLRVEPRVEPFDLLRHEEDGDHAGSPDREQQAQATTGERQAKRFGQQLAHQGPARRSERHLDRQIAPARHGPRQQQAADIEARARQEQHRSAADDEANHEDLVASGGVQLRVTNRRHPPWRVRLNDAAAIRGWILRRQIVGDAAQIVFCLLDGHPAAQPGDNREPPIAARAAGRGHQNPRVALVPGAKALKARRRDASDRVLPVANRDRLSHDFGGAAELFRQLEADDGNGRTRRRVC